MEIDVCQNTPSDSIHAYILDGSASSDMIEAALDLLDEQWPHERSMRENRNASICSGSKDKLPIHITLIRRHKTNRTSFDETVISYAKLQGAYGKDFGHSAVVYSVVVKKELRGHGFGKRIMNECEKIAKKLGLTYLYLYTDDQVGFYKHLGYLECEPISSLGQNAKRLKPSQVEALEGIFAKRLNPEERRDHSQTWLRKRLMTCSEKRPPCDWTTLCSIAVCAVKCYEGSKINRESTFLSNSRDASGSKNLALVYIEVSHEQQVGPMCGLTALSMAVNSIRENCNSMTDNYAESVNMPCDCCGQINDMGPDHKMDNILDFAINLQITRDGEIFCAHNLVYLCHRWYSLPSHVFEIQDEKSFLKHLLLSLKTGNPVLIAYDRDIGGFLPTMKNGNAAHWAVICGILYERNDIKYEGTRNVYKEGSFYLSPITKAASLDFREAISLAMTLLASQDKERDFFLVCVHGMSRLPFVCHVSEMLASNANLLHCGSKFFKAPSELSHLKKKAIFLAETRVLDVTNK